MKFTSYSVARISRAIRDQIRVRESARRLHGLDDRMLADMGITRGEIDGLVRGRSLRRS